MKGDVEVIKRRNEAAEMAAMRTGARPKKVDYIPVVFPGGSGYNLSEGKWGFNDIKRRGGRFLWKQIFNAKRLGVRTMYGAMWDEYDEGTAFMPIVEHKRRLPQSDKFQFLALDADGFDVPSDWYMRICGFAAEGLRSERRVHETFPVKELQDYWSSRPRYEEGVDIGGSSSTGASGSKPDANGGQSYEEFLEAEKANKQDEAPPPPYTLEADEVRPTPASVGLAPAPATVQPQTSSVPPAQAAPATTIQPGNFAPQSSPIPTQASNQVSPASVSPTPQGPGALQHL
ncbi:hypothetical protein NLJ89_g11823 [Agrocybe chaxingu]|uniref:Uncharacterized protein n=1 Tax=Agrocybe chaxingu TaxID=84603 RepID=A0A9W8JRP3_9AGAR|nr:hypothetical protein NLJ89_g11823 [Agrocybe chaxingu]